VPNRLLEAVIVADARFRLEVGIGEERRREVQELLAQRRRLEGGPVTRLELGLAPRNDDGRRDSVGRMGAEELVVVDPAVRHKKEALLILRLEFDKGAL